MIELNLWYSHSGNIYGNLNIKHKSEVFNVKKMLTIENFVASALKEKKQTEEELIAFIANADAEARYAYAGDHLVSWNPKSKTAFVIFDNEVKTLQMTTKMRSIKGMPDICFRS